MKIQLITPKENTVTSKNNVISKESKTQSLIIIPFNKNLKDRVLRSYIILRTIVLTSTREMHIIKYMIALS